MMASSVLLGVEARLAKTDAVLLFTCVAAMGAMARIYLMSRRTPDVAVGWRLPAILWTAMAAGVLIKGPLILMFVGLDRAHAVDRRPLGPLDLVAAPVRRPGLADAAGAALVRRDRRQVRRRFHRAVGRRGHAGQGDRRTGIAWRAAGILLSAVLGDVLAGLGAGGTGRAARLAGAARAGRALSAGVADAVLGGVRGGDHQAAALRAAALSGDRDPDRRHSRRRRSRDKAAGWCAAPSAGFSFRRRSRSGSSSIFIIVGRDLGLVAWPFAAAATIFGLFAWWLYEVDGPERALLRGMVASVLIAITVYAVTFPSLPALFPSALIADELRAGDCAEPQVAATGYYQEPSLVFLLGTDTRFTDGTGAAIFLGQGPCRFALIDARSERKLRAARQCDRIALRAQPARRRLQHQHRAAGGAHRVPLDGKAMTAANGIDRDARRRARRRLRRCAANVAAAFAMLARPPRIHARNPWPLAPRAARDRGRRWRW